MTLTGKKREKREMLLKKTVISYYRRSLNDEIYF